MAEFVSPEDWGLQAIVKGSTRVFWSNTPCITVPNHCGKAPRRDDDDRGHLLNFPSLFDSSSVMLNDELQQLYKPFCSVPYPLPPQNSPAAPTTPSDLSVYKGVKEELEPEPVPEPADREKLDETATTTTTAYTPKYKRRKNHQKRVVLQVTAKDLSSDKWAWRKYGQKPIKGSPYPRSYYRCSSSKGCLARKQVEQSCKDSGIFIITYTAEHNHSQPTRRNALAGTVRHKFGAATKSPTPTNTDGSISPKTGDSDERYSSNFPTPYSVGAAHRDQEELVGGNVERQNNKDESVHMKILDGLIIPDVMFDDDFFSCFNDLDEFISELGDS